MLLPILYSIMSINVKTPQFARPKKNVCTFAKHIYMPCKRANVMAVAKRCKNGVLGEINHCLDISHPPSCSRMTPPFLRGIIFRMDMFR